MKRIELKYFDDIDSLIDYEKELYGDMVEEYLFFVDKYKNKFYLAVYKVG